jgi:hypothetical protein
VSEALRMSGAATWTGSGERPSAALLTPRMRGRASLLTSMFANVVEHACREAAIDPRAAPMIFASAYGEMGTTRTLLEQLHESGALSPAKFQASVHNTAAGQLSIALGNRNFCTAIAAGPDTLAMALIEAQAFLHAHPGHVVVACGDEGATTALQPGLTYPPLAAAFVLTNVAGRALARLSRVQVCAEPVDAAAAADNPCAPALALAAASRSGERRKLRLNPAAEYGLALELDATGGEA